MAQPLIVDTNVLLVASDAHAKAAAIAGCVEACINILSEIRGGNRKIVLDEIGLIAGEYGNKLTPRGPRVGDQFLLWLLNNQYNTDYCDRVDINPLCDNDDTSIISFEEFPEVAELASFDLSDRKFVAVALAHPAKPPILNATDSDWHAVTTILATYGIRVDFLCRGLLE